MDFESRVVTVVEPLLRSIEEEMLDKDIKAAPDYSPILNEISNMEHAIKSEVVRIEKTVNRLLEENNKEEKEKKPESEERRRKVKELLDRIGDKMKEETKETFKRIFKNLLGNTADFLLPDAVDQLFLEKDYNDWGLPDIFENWVQDFVRNAPLWTYIIKESTKNNLQYTKMMNGIEKAQQLIQAGTSNIVLTLDNMQSILEHVLQHEAQIKDAIKYCCDTMHTSMTKLGSQIDQVTTDLGHAIDYSTETIADQVSQCCTQTQRGLGDNRDLLQRLLGKSDSQMAHQEMLSHDRYNRRLPSR